MNKEQFIQNYRNAFGDYELPIVFWYSEEPVALAEKTRGCFIGNLKTARKGQFYSLSADTISCPGGKIYTGFSAAPPFIGGFVSGKERYKESEALVTDFISNLNMPDRKKAYINFVSIDKVENFDRIEGLIFFATPDVLSGLISWALYDTNKADAVSVPFGSGCSSMISETLVENQKQGHRCFLGMFDPSARPQVDSNVLTLGIPLSRFEKMLVTMEESCIQGTHAWKKVKQRIENEL